jgi:hypothetical protein
MFKRFQGNVKDIKCPLKWWVKHESFTIFAHQIFNIMGFQIGSERIFSLLRILTNLRRCHLQSNNLNKIFFISKN